jgi:hypothetical protein
VKLEEPYERRAIRPLGLWDEAGWRLKMYGITYRGECPSPELVEAAKVTARHRLPQASLSESAYGVGFLGVHQGRDSNFVFLDWWQDENELHHHVFVSPHDKPELLEYATPRGLLGCVWDLRVVEFERLAWIDTVLANPHGPNLEAYLTRQLSGDV